MNIGIITNSIEYLKIIINVINSINNNNNNTTTNTNNIKYIITNNAHVFTYCLVNLKTILNIFNIKTADTINDDFISILPKVDLQIMYSFYIIPKILYMHPKYKTINIHYSLLPSYRGPNPVLAQILKNEKYTGISIHYVSDVIDDGNNIIAQTDKIPIIYKNTNTNSYYATLSLLNKKVTTTLERTIRLINYKKILDPIKTMYENSYYSKHQIKQLTINNAKK
jgi:methionyl-tRNA formyltransferase